MKLRRSYLVAITVLLLASCATENTTDSQSETPEAAVEVTNEETEEPLTLERDPRLIGGEKSADQVTIEQAIDVMNEQAESELIGYWVGDFGGNKINLSIYRIDGNQAYGYSVCAGNFRPIKGLVAAAGEDVMHFELAEPGDDKYDGAFSLDVELGQQQMTGSWKPFIEEGNSPKTFTLTKRAFEYDPSVGLFPEASDHLLNDEELMNLLPEDLELMRNAIYARHGYSFKNKKMRYRFNQEEWYMPMGVDIRDQLTDIEAANIDRIYAAEAYQEEYYDEFGR